jgi:hypothetical protein
MMHNHKNSVTFDKEDTSVSQACGQAGMTPLVQLFLVPMGRNTGLDLLAVQKQEERSKFKLQIASCLLTSPWLNQITWPN